MEPKNSVDFVGEVEARVLGTGKSYYVLPSHPTRVRGLKLDLKGWSKMTLKSHLVQVRGLKL